jgi:hypothetical protein
MKASLVVYDDRELHKKSKLKIVKYGHIKGCPKRPMNQIGSLKILGVNTHFEQNFTTSSFLELELDVLGVPGRLVKYGVHSSKRKI